MTFGAGSTGGKYTTDLRAAIGAVNGDVAAIGYHAVSAITGVSYNNGLGSTSGSTPGTVKSVNHSTAVTQADGSSPTQIQPYQAAYFWRRTA